MFWKPRFVFLTSHRDRAAFVGASRSITVIGQGMECGFGSLARNQRSCMELLFAHSPRGTTPFRGGILGQVKANDRVHLCKRPANFLFAL
jgi:hypothetical protein